MSRSPSSFRRRCRSRTIGRSLMCSRCGEHPIPTSKAKAGATCRWHQICRKCCEEGGYVENGLWCTNCTNGIVPERDIPAKEAKLCRNASRSRTSGQKNRTASSAFMGSFQVKKARLKKRCFAKNVSRQPDGQKNLCATSARKASSPQRGWHMQTICAGSATVTMRTRYGKIT